MAKAGMYRGGTTWEGPGCFGVKQRDWFALGEGPHVKRRLLRFSQEKGNAAKNTCGLSVPMV
jgi:hypothetical protein